MYKSLSRSINSEVNVVSYYFGQPARLGQSGGPARPVEQTGGGNVRSFPKRIELDGKEFDFKESGLRCLVKKGQEYIQIFNMTDGNSQFRLQFQPEQRLWTLLTMKSMRA